MEELNSSYQDTGRIHLFNKSNSVYTEDFISKRENKRYFYKRIVVIDNYKLSYIILFWGEMAHPRLNWE